MTNSLVFSLINTIVTYALTALMEPLFLQYFGTTPGKAVFGLKLTNPDGSKLTYKRGLRRTTDVLWFGCGFGIPVYGLVRLWKCYKICNENEAPTWDDGISYKIKDRKAYRGFLLIAVHLALIAVTAVVALTQYLPPNRGPLTVAQFAENFNYYTEFLDVDFGNRQLNSKGKWDNETEELNGYYFEMFSSYPDIRYEEENGRIKTISFAYSLKNFMGFPYDVDDKIYISSLSAIGAQKDAGLYPMVTGTVAALLKAGTLTSFNVTQYGVTLICDVADTDTGENNLSLNNEFYSNIHEGNYILSFTIVMP